MKNNVLKIIIVVVLILLLCMITIGIILTRKHFMIKGIRDNLAKYKSSNNYYVKMINEDDESKVISEIYKKESNYLEKIEIINGDNVSQTCDIYSIDGEIHKYIIAGDNKLAVMKNNNDNEHSDLFCDIFNISNKWNYIKMLWNIKISNENYNGKECYFINLDKCVKYMDDYFGNFLLGENEKIEDYKLDYYIEKDTGLIVKTSIGPYNEYEYKFDIVTDEDLVEPDISDYDVK